MNLAEYMGDCLLNQEYGYYTTRDPFGVAGDFTTAPEVSQMFGELLGLALAQYWLDLGRPAPFLLAEIGPGRGTLMADVLRATRQVPGFHQGAQIWLIEASGTLRARQRQCLAAYEVKWANHLQDLPPAPLFLLANEFFDALPIRQFTREADGWAEIMVGLSADGNLAFGRRPVDGIPIETPHENAPVGTVVEICPAAAPIMAEIGQRLADHCGLALIIDYGDWAGTGDTMQAVQAHRGIDPLACPGEADLTAHVDFAALAAAVAPAETCFTTQGTLLLRLGLRQRAEVLAARLKGEALKQHLAAAKRLTDASEMGTLFKVLAIYPQGAGVPPGFE